MTTKNDGGPAFPLQDGAEQLESPLLVQGASLRDYFAGRAMTGIIAVAEINTKADCCRHIAHAAFMLADAMLEARNK